MKLLFDEQLSSRLVESLADIYPESEQILALGLGGAGDGTVWDYAKLHGLMIVSKDLDFYDRSLRVRRSTEGDLAAARKLHNRCCRNAVAQ